MATPLRTRADVLLEADNVSYRRCGAASVRRVSVAALRGELLALCGPPGSGTSTLLALLGGVCRPDAGRVIRHGGGAPVVTHGGHSAWAALAAAHDGSVLLLDHPSDPDECEDDVLRAARAAAEAGAAVVVTTHDLELVSRHAHTAALLVAGRLIAWADPAQAFVPAVRLLGCSTPSPDAATTASDAPAVRLPSRIADPLPRSRA